MRRQICDSLERLIADIPEPDDFFAGKERSEEELPDNVLLFTRRRAKELHQENVPSSLHQRWVLILALRGSGTVEMDRISTRLAGGNAVIIPPLHLHDYSALDKDLLWLFATFEWPGHTALGEAWQGPRRLNLLAFKRLELLITEWHTPRTDGLLTASYLFLLLRQLFPTATPPKSHEEKDHLIASVRAAAADAPKDKLDAIARRVGLSESHLRMRFRKEAGISVGRYLREVRLRQTAVWLREEGLTVKSAAERAGYPDIYSFSRAFKKALGVPPSQIRASHGE